jgi:hypothetical protein
MRLQLLDYLVDALAQIFRLEVGPSLRALVLLPSVIVSVDTLVIGEIDILALIAALAAMAIGLAFDVVLILGVVRQLVQIVLVLVPAIANKCVDLFRINPSLDHFVFQNFFEIILNNISKINIYI